MGITIRTWLIAGDIPQGRGGQNYNHLANQCWANQLNHGWPTRKNDVHGENVDRTQFKRINVCPSHKLNHVKTLLRDAAKRNVMAASRLLVILLSFAAEDRKSYWNGCIQAATVICPQIFSILALVIFLLNIIVKNVSKLFFFSALASRSGFGAAICDSVARSSIVFCNSDSVARSSIVFCNSVSADRIVVAASRLLGAAAAFVILLF